MAAKKKPADVATKKDSGKPVVAKKSPAQVRVYTEWTPLMLRSAERQAEQGNLQTAVSICDWILTDDRVAASLSARVEQLMGLEPTFEAGTGKRAAAAAKALEADEDWWESYPESELTQLHTWGLVLGGGLGHHNWEEREDHGGRLLPKPTFWHPQRLRFDWPTRQLLVRDASDTELVVVPGDGEWILHAPYGQQRFWAYGLWRRLARLVLLKQYAIGDWGRHSEKGSLLVATSLKSTQQQRQELAQDLAGAGEDPVVALPDGFDLKLVEVAANTQAIYDAQIKMANEAIAITIRGANLSTNVEGGSRAAAETQKKTGDDAKLRFDASALTTTIHDQSLVWWAEFNFGDPKLAPWPMYPVEPDEDMGQRATMISTLAEGLTKLDTLGYDFDLKVLQEEFGLTFITGRPRPTRVPEPKLPGAAPGAKPGEKKPAPAKKTGKEARALASGATEGIQGFLDGQDHVDRIVEEGTSAFSEAIAAELATLRKLIANASSLDQLEAAVGEHYQTQDPARVIELTERALRTAHYAGARAVDQDL